MTTPSQQTSAQPLKAYFVLLIVIFAAATGPIFICNAQQAGVPSLYIIAARLISTSLILAPIVLKRYRSEMSRLPAREWLLVMASGLSFLLNLLFLFVSLEYASVLVTGVMRRTTPLWVIWLEIIFLGAVFVTIITQFLGHIPINVGLRYFHATYISIIMQVAVVASAVLAFVAFNEIPSPMQFVGSVAIMFGVVLVNWR